MIFAREKDKELEAKESEIKSLVEHISSLKDHLSLVEGVAPAEVLRYDKFHLTLVFGKHLLFLSQSTEILPPWR